MASSVEKKAEFRQYLETSGVMDAIVKSLVLLYQEPTRPDDPLAFVVSKLGGAAGEGGSCADKDDKIAELNQTVDDLRSKLGQHEPPPPADAAPAAEAAAAEAAPEADARAAEEVAEIMAPEEEAPPAPAEEDAENKEEAAA